MKKRIGSFLLALVLTFLLIPSLAVDASAAAIDESYNTGVGKGGGGGALDSSIFSSAVVQNTSASGSGTAKSLEVEVKLKTFSSKNSVYALVMKASDYSTYVQTSGGPQSAGIDGTSYFQQSNFDSKYYAIGRKNPNAGTAGETISLPLVVASTENASSLGADKPVSNKTMPAATVTSDNYFDEYVLLVFSTEVASDDNYYVDRFYVDADGYVRTPSYLIRYNANNPVGTGNVDRTPTRAIIRALPGGVLAESTTLSDANPARMGYTFLGWSKTAKTASADLTVSDTDYAAGASYPKPGTLYTVNDLHAVWKTIPVAFATVGESKNQTVADPVRVGVTLSQTFNLDDTVSGGTKNYRVTQVTVAGVATNDSTKFPNNIPAGLKIERSETKQWILSGTPAYDCDKPIVMTVEVADQSNTTVDTMQLTISKIEKGLQLPPDTTVTTGLSTTMVDENDGRLIGFYAAGQESKKDSADATMTDGTGTYTDYYLTKGMVYEYRPKTDAELPWRAIPVPESYYNLTDETTKAAFMAALAAKSTGNLVTTKVIEGGSIYSIEQVTDWNETYGAIQFVDGLPVVTGLTKDTEYEVRFRGNDTFDASPAATITVGGAAASTGGGYTLTYNLAGGALPGGTDGTIFAEQSITKDMEITVPNVVPVRDGCSFDGWIFGIQRYQPGEKFTASGDSSVPLAAQWTATTEGFVSITFFDWDESILGSAIIRKQATAAEVDAVLEGFTDRFYSGFVTKGEAEKDSTTATVLPAPLNTDGYVADTAYPLTNKDGYHFTGWMQATEERPIDTFSSVHNENRDEALVEAQGMLLDTAAHQGAWENMNLKAVYTGNEKLQISGGNATYYSVVGFEGDMYGNSTNAAQGNAAIQVTVERKNASGQPVARLQEPMIQAIYTIEGKNVYLQGTLLNVDTAFAEFVSPKNTTKIQFKVYEGHGKNVVNNQAMSATIPKDNRLLESGGTYESSFLVMAATDSVSKRAWAQNKLMKTHATSSDWTTGVGAYTLNTEVGLTYDNLAADRYKLLLVAYGFGNNVVLTAEQLQAALDLEFVNITLPIKNPTASNGVYEEMDILYGYIEKAIENCNSGLPLSSVAQVHKALESMGTAIN